MTLARKAVFMLGLLFVSTGLVHAQTVVTGTPLFGTFGGGPADSINLANLNVHLTIPVLSKPGRGIPFTYDITYDNSIWQPVGTSGSQTWQPTNTGAFGWSFPAIGSLVPTYQYDNLTCGQWYGVPGDYFWVWGGGYYVTSYTYKDVLGTPHNFPGGVTVYWGCAGNGPTQYTGTATDGSGYILTVTTAGAYKVTARSAQTAVYSSSGQNITNTPLYTDSNGNQITLNGSNVFTDTLGQAAMTVSGTAPSNTNFQYKDTNGNTQQFTMKYTSVTVKTNFGCSGITDYPATAQNLVSEMDLPDIGTNPSDKYTFAYESTPGYSGDVTGRLKSVTLPTGGTIYYTYSGGNNGIVCADGSTATLTRQTPDGTWTYAHSESGTAWTTTQTDPQSNVTTMNFQGIYLTQSSNALKTTFTCYNNAAVPCNSTTITPPITLVASILRWPNGLQSQMNTYYNSTSGLVTRTDEYDYGSGATGPVLRTTLTSYASLGNGIVNAPASVTVEDGSGAIKAQTNYTYDGATLVSSGITTQHISVSGSRGNPTQVSSLVSGSTYVNQNFTYFDTGMVNVAKDGKNNPTTYAYSSTYQGAYPTTVTNALSQITTTTYDINSGLLTSVKDPNNQTTTYAYDLMLRPTQTNHPDGGQSSFSYAPQFGGNYVREDDKMDTSSNYKTSFAWFDGLGRQARVAVSNGEVLHDDETLNTCFNASGLVSLQGYPFQDNGWSSPISCSVAGDTYTYDAMGRPRTITHADGSWGSISYTANCVTATDEQGKQRTVCADGLGRVTSVVENPGGLNYSTTYVYDTLNNLTTVTQNGRNRSFVYDGLSRLTSATNPESGTTSYTYDAASNVATRTDARNITTTYSYDALNRLTSKTYSDGTPGAYFYYDQSSWAGINLSNGTGRLTSQGVFNGTNWLASSGFSYDALGRAINNPQWTAMINTTLQVPYTFDLIGDMTTYGNGGASWLTFTQSFNVGGRVTQLTSNWVDSQHPATLISGAHYNGAGSVTSFTYGNGLTHTRVYNNLLQPCLIDVNSSTTLLQTCNDSSPSGNVLDFWYGYNAGSSDNGNVMNWNATGQQSSIRTYSYDALNRLGTMADSVQSQSCRGLSWSYDQWGNRTAQNVTAGTCGSSQLTFNSSNHVTNSGFQYDAAGNMTHDASHSYTYDAENRITKVDGGSTATYGYDVDGRRVSRVVAGVETDYIYDLSGHVVADYGGGCGATCWRVGYVYLNGQVLAEYFGGTYFVHTDHLGSTRLLTNYPTPTVAECDDYYPFGEQASCGGTSTTTHKFTGYERDAESGLDNAQARYNSSSLGRFMSPDPIGNFVADATNPQTWNLYTYALNNPLRFIDPTGTDGLDYYDCIGSGNDPSQCGPPPTSSCDVQSGCIVYVNGNAPTWEQDPNPPQYPTDACSTGGCSPTGGGGTGGGAGPRKPKVCSNLALKLKSLEWTVKLGAEAEVGPVDVGAGLFKNVTTQETGGQIEANVSDVAGLSLENVNPSGAAMNSDAGQLQLSGQIAGLNHNFGTGASQTNFGSKSIGGTREGLMLGIGLEVSLNGDTYKRLASQCTIITVP